MKPTKDANDRVIHTQLVTSSPGGTDYMFIANPDVADYNPHTNSFRARARSKPIIIDLVKLATDIGEEPTLETCNEIAYELSARDDLF